MEAKSVEGIESLVPLIIKLQSAFSMIKTPSSIELPQLVVVGSQSSGKSSVLESIVGRDFLPRGSGIVTRCPLILSLRYIDPDRAKQNSQDYGEFEHKKGQKFTNFDLIRKEIELQTEKIAGTNKGVSDQPIYLTIHSQAVVDLTLVDLPGITKVPIKGQASDIESQIKRLIMRYIRPPNALILALSAANTDLANSDALQMAKEVDPHGDRTIGVVTKIDLMDEGTDAIEILQGKLYPLKLGYFGVKCRSQKAIDDKVLIREAIQVEQEFFSRHPVYAAHSTRMGVPYLTKSLNCILVAHIQNCIPGLSKQISQTIQQKERELLTFDSEYVITDKRNQGPLILNLISKYVETYSNKLHGNFVKDIATECQGGARINYIFHKVFRNVVAKVDPFEYLTEQDIQTAIKNASAMSPSLFVPEQAFEVLIKQQIARLLEPSLQCSQLVYEELRRLMLQIELPELTKFYKLQSRMHDVMESVLNECLGPTNEMILNLIEIETSLINTNHPDFVGSADSLLNLFSEQQDQKEDLTFQGVDQKQFSLASKPEKQEVQIQNVAGSTGGVVSDSQASSWLPTFFQRKKPDQPIQIVPAEELHIETKQKELPPQSQNSFSNYSSTHHYKPKLNKGYLPEIFLAQVPAVIRSHPNQDSSRVIMETRVIQNLIQSYFGIVKKNTADLVPKTIMALLVNESKRLAQSELVVKVYQAEDLDSLLVEDPIVAANRESCKQMIKALRTAQCLLAEVTQYRL